MGLRYQKRVKLGKGVGLNVSKSGVSPSLRTKYGSISPKGFSIRTGIPGLTYKGGKNNNAAGVMLAIGVVTVGALFMGWLVREVYHFILRRKMDLLHKNAQENQE